MTTLNEISDDKNPGRKIVLSGGSGFIGRHLVERFLSRGWEVVLLSRQPEKLEQDPLFSRVGLVKWSTHTDSWYNCLADADVVVNLAGKNLSAGRWNARMKAEIISSRTDPLEAMTRCFDSIDSYPELFIQFSAVGYYGRTTSMNTSEDAPAGKGFLSEVCQKWESGLSQIKDVDETRLVILRPGVVLGIEDGFYRRMACMVRHFMGAVIGKGQNWVSWIHIQDLVGIVDQVIDRKEVEGVINAVAPEPVQSREFMKNLAATWSRPLLPAPPLFVLRLTLGEMVDELVLASQHIAPERLWKMGYKFRFSSSHEALSDLRDKCSKRKTPIPCPDDTTKR